MHQPHRRADRPAGLRFPAATGAVAAGVTGAAARLQRRKVLLAPSEVGGRVPKLGIVVSVQEAYTQCSKAFIRSDLWNPEHHLDRSELPSSGAILRSLNDPAFDGCSDASHTSTNPVGVMTGGSQ